MNKEIRNNNFNDIYYELLKLLIEAPENTSTNRKGETIYELNYPTIILEDPNKCYATMRNMSMPYLIGELLFYLKGYNKLNNIKYYSKFWEKISDDGKNLNSCYGFYFYRMPIPCKQSQMQYCIEQLKINKESKKAVMTIYSGELHSYKTKDNPCTMYAQFFIRENSLQMIVNMRSNDIWFGLPYDIPFFTFVQKQVYFNLLKTYSDLKLGLYIHRSNSLHLYKRNLQEAKQFIMNPAKLVNIPDIKKEDIDNLDYLIRKEKDISGLLIKLLTIKKADFLVWGAKILYNYKWLKEAWKVSKKSKCLKKEVGGVYVKNNKILSTGWSGRPGTMGKCKVCTRKTETFFQDGCNSIHSEYRGLFNFLKKINTHIEMFKNSIVYLTHGPCDQCMKLLIELGVSKCIFDVYYKTQFKKYNGYITVEDKNGRVLCDINEPIIK